MEDLYDSQLQSQRQVKLYSRSEVYLQNLCPLHCGPVGLKLSNRAFETLDPNFVSCDRERKML